MFSWCLRFLPKNERKQVNLRYHIVVKSNSFVHFLEDFTAWQFAFEFYWPLVGVQRRANLCPRSFWMTNNTINYLKLRNLFELWQSGGFIFYFWKWLLCCVGVADPFIFLEKSAPIFLPSQRGDHVFYRWKVWKKRHTSWEGSFVRICTS